MSTVTEEKKDSILVQKIEQDYLGRFLKDNLKGVILVVVLLLVAASSYGVYRYVSFRNQLAMSELLYSFKVDGWEKFREGKMNESEFDLQWESLLKNSKDSVQLLPLVMEMADHFIEKGGKEVEKAEKIVKASLDLMPSASVAHYYLSSYMATFYEDQGKGDQAITLLESLLASKHKFLEAKIYFDLGRLYAKKGDKEKAKINLQYVTENFYDNSLAKMAKIYLQRL